MPLRAGPHICKACGKESGAVEDTSIAYRNLHRELSEAGLCGPAHDLDLILYSRKNQRLAMLELTRYADDALSYGELSAEYINSIRDRFNDPKKSAWQRDVLARLAIMLSIDCFVVVHPGEMRPEFPIYVARLREWEWQRHTLAQHRDWLTWLTE